MQGYQLGRSSACSCRNRDFSLLVLLVSSFCLVSLSKNSTFLLWNGKKSLSMKTLRIKTLGLSSPFSPFFSQVEEGMMASWQVRPAEWMLTKRWDLCWIWSDPNFHNQNCGNDDVWLMKFPSWKCSFQETVGNMWKTQVFLDEFGLHHSRLEDLQPSQLVSASSSVGTCPVGVQRMHHNWHLSKV